MTKYHAVPTVIDGVRFASKAEARRYQALRLLQRSKQISGLELQPKYPIVIRNLDGADVKVATYIADFRYVDQHRHLVIEDVKGVKTAVYRIKKKLVEALYGITITEVR